MTTAGKNQNHDKHSRGTASDNTLWRPDVPAEMANLSFLYTPLIPHFPKSYQPA